MKKAYETPVVEKVVFDYKAQIVTESTPACHGSVINTATAENECGEGTPMYFGWNSNHPGEF